jgi:outer membrane putative beta-barrel porin/alpha-amylase
MKCPRLHPAALGGAVLAAALGAGSGRAADEPAAGDAPKEEAPGIMDNSFFIEEAYNQEAGVVQNIFTFQPRFRQVGATEESFQLTFTQEWPVPSMDHQLSYTVPFIWQQEPGARSEGFGDVLLNYRYQALVETPSQPAFAPRFSLVLPTGDKDKGRGHGEVGYQFNLPLSKKIGERLFIHLNAGATITPQVDLDLENGSRSPTENLVDYQAGFSLIYILRHDFNLLLETFAARLQEIDTVTGSKEDQHIMVISPGARYAINFKGGAQMVLGLGFPIGLTRDTDDFGVLFYFSFESALWGTGNSP